MVGSFGHMGVFSCYPTKNLGALGDAGLITTNNSEYLETLILKRQYGWKRRNFATDSGGNFRLDELQASVLRVKLKYLLKMNRSRRNIAQKYFEGLSDLNIRLPYSESHVQHAYHQFVISVDQRDELKRYLENHLIYTNIHYPFPVHLQPGYRDRVRVFGNLNKTILEAKRILSLPIFPELSDREVTQVIKAIQDFFSKRN
jgi:dTDP-4-amino-4,6-dideoxygalactose transaminase